ncbi:conserved hypothetical protein [Perkinsus marinus ATCC 50983]|uniref:J domain-containing protein n=1 Tax=Perkinsus marinus (strain ATCC 50983 / TXsc) TaxID=423536 RepID=C5L236_PERM5|nr:conserved hypothetical protein [Perkinsus marinus ATCC 50983]EER09229.1 conserved hypothetical protein [Perkinsus marinus ATCC 50983]|eukprot:XP_002777413.1 conserved hypothetical protein [Perkinsus marinus ATCC 50983]
MRKDYYDILGVKKEADEIKKAYRRMAPLKWQSDKNLANKEAVAEEFKEDAPHGFHYTFSHGPNDMFAQFFKDSV